MLQGKTCWYPLYVPFEKKSVFCMTKAHAHEVYGLSDFSVDARALGARQNSPMISGYNVLRNCQEGAARSNVGM